MEKVYNIKFSVGETPCSLVSINPEATTKDTSYYDHYHHGFELHYCFKGEVSFLCAEKLMSFKGGEILLIPPRIYHKEAYSSPDSKKMSIAIRIFESEVPSFFYDCFNKITEPLCFMATEEIEKLIEQIAEDSKGEESDIFIREKLKISSNSLILSLSDYLSQNQHHLTEGGFKTLPSQEYIINKFFAKNYMSNASNKALADELHISTRQLHRILQKLYGANYRDQLLQIRLKIATGFLTGTDKSIAEISEMMGYGSPANFATFIKKVTGKTPGQIRKEGKKFNT